MKYSIYISVIAGLLANSCEMVVDVEIPTHKPTLVINSFIDPSEPFSAQISNSLGVLDRGEIKSIDSAVVKIYEGDILIDQLQLSQNGNYISANKFPLPGKSYKITASASPYDDVYATAEVPSEVNISDIVFKDSVASGNSYNITSSVTFTIHDPSIKNYYEVSLYYLIYDSLTLESQLSPIYVYSNDPAIESNDAGSNNILFTDEHFNGKNYNLEILFSPVFHPEGKVSDYDLVLNFANASEGAFLYKTTLSKNQASFNPFAEPAPVYTNIKNGLGIFAGKNSSYITVPR